MQNQQPTLSTNGTNYQCTETLTEIINLQKRVGLLFDLHTVVLANGTIGEKAIYCWHWDVTKSVPLHVCDIYNK